MNDMKYLAALIIALVFCLGCGKKPEPPVLRMFCCETFQDVMKEEAELFASTYGVWIAQQPIIVVEAEEPLSPSEEGKRRSPAPWRARPSTQRALPSKASVLEPRISELIREIADRKRYGDFYLTDSPRQTELLHEGAAVAMEYPFCFLTLTLLVGKGNPLRVESVKSLLADERRLGIIDPSVDGMGETASRLISKISEIAAKDFSSVQTTMFEQHEKLLEALKNGDVDAVLLWEPLARKTVEFAETVELPEAERQTLRQPLIALSLAENHGFCRRFADFLLSPKGREILKKHGFVPIPQ